MFQTCDVPFLRDSAKFVDIEIVRRWIHVSHERSPEGSRKHV